MHVSGLVSCRPSRRSLSSRTPWHPAPPFYLYDASLVERKPLGQSKQGTQQRQGTSAYETRGAVAVIFMTMTLSWYCNCQLDHEKDYGPPSFRQNPATLCRLAAPAFPRRFPAAAPFAWQPSPTAVPSSPSPLCGCRSVSFPNFLCASSHVFSLLSLISLRRLFSASFFSPLSRPFSLGGRSPLSSINATFVCAVAAATAGCALA